MKEMNWFIMMKTRKMVLALAIGVFFNPYSMQAQRVPAAYPVVGEPIPAFRLTDVHYYAKNYFDPKEVQGKWLILDFWSLGCTSCVQSFPKTNRLQADFKDQVQFLLIGINDKKYNKNIEQAFEVYTKRLGLNLAIAYDSVLYKQFGVSGVPHIVIVDPEGKVYAITHGTALTHDNLQALTSHQKPVLPVKDAPGIKLPPAWSYEIYSKKQVLNNLLYRSVLSSNQGEGLISTEIIDQNVSEGFFQIVGYDLALLYKLAWFGQFTWMSWDTSHYYNYWRDLVLEVRDSSLFQSDYGTHTGFYNYSLIVPRQKSTKEYLMKRMQSDLENNFGYTAAIETRMMPYWKLTATEVAKKKLKSTRTKWELVERGPAVINGRALTIEALVHQIIRYYPGHIPIIDETGITGFIDINIKAAFIDIEDVRKALRKDGLLLEKGIRPMKVLVVRDVNKSTASH